VFKTIAWAAGDSSSALNALTVAKRLVRDIDGKLLILYVRELAVGQAVILPDGNNLVPMALRRRVEELRDDGIDATVVACKATGGDVARAIANLADETDADLIVVGAERRGPLTGLMFGNVASQLLRAASCPVLAVPLVPGRTTRTTRSADSAGPMTSPERAMV
jgi:nucleotide-binding universal stress UspA family protein